MFGTPLSQWGKRRWLEVAEDWGVPQKLCTFICTTPSPPIPVAIPFPFQCVCDGIIGM